MNGLRAQAELPPLSQQQITCSVLPHSADQQRHQSGSAYRNYVSSQSAWLVNSVDYCI